MQYIDGITLSEYAKMHAISTTDSARLLIKLLQATQVFHDRNLVHRDLKPGNIILDSRQEPFITDFGLAKTVRPDEITVTHSGQIVGTLHYMSPEQVRAAADIDGRSDIYALGVILYQLLTGERPFKPQSEHTLLYAILHDDPPPPRKLNAKIPRDLETICLKAMEKAPAGRYESASQMAESLQLFLDGKPIPDKPVSRIEKAVKWVSRNRAVAVSSLVATLAVVIAAGEIMFSPAPSRVRPLPPDPDPIPTPIPDQIPGKMLALLNTEPAHATLEFTRYTEVVKVPRRNSQEVVTSQSGEVVQLEPGLYKVRAWWTDGGYHEVWRMVPQADDGPFGLAFPHLTFGRTAEGFAALPTVTRPPDDLSDFVLFYGGEFEMGYEGPSGMYAAHTHPVDDFYIGKREVSFRQIREALASTGPNGPDGQTYLEVVAEHYGAINGADESPATGLHPDVIMLVTELLGGRLPMPPEYEYAATNGGRSRFPTGDSPAVSSAAAWEFPDVGAHTPDRTPIDGIENLNFGVAELMDCAPFNYSMRYPQLFGARADKALALPEKELYKIAGVYEVRGGPTSLIVAGAPATDNELDVRIPTPINLSTATAANIRDRMKHVGFRLYRSAPLPIPVEMHLHEPEDSVRQLSAN